MSFIFNIDTVDDPKLLTFWSIHHFSNMALIYAIVYSVFKAAYITLQLNSDSTTRSIVWTLIGYLVTNEILQYEFKDRLSEFAFRIRVISIFVGVLIGLSSLTIKDETAFLHGICFIVTIAIQVIYELFTSGPNNKDSWWTADGLAPSNDRYSNSWLNSFGDVVTGTLGCIVAFTLIVVFDKIGNTMSPTVKLVLTTVIPVAIFAVVRSGIRKWDDRMTQEGAILDQPIYASV